jgi:ACS family glucarate transporter-like MFS transporter
MPVSTGSADRVQTKIVTLMVAFSIMSYFDRTIMAIAGPHIMKEFAVSETAMGAVYSAFVFSYVLLMVPGGRLADRFGPRWVLTVIGLGAALFTGMTALGGRPGLGSYLGIVPSFLAIRLGLGMMTAPLYPSCAKMTSNWFPLQRHASVQGLIIAGTGLGSACSPLLFSWMIIHRGWRMSFCLAGVTTAALAVLWYWYVRDYPDEHPSIRNNGPFLLGGSAADQAHKPASTPWRRLLTDRNLMLLTLAYGTLGYFEYMFFYWIYYYFGQIRRMGSSETAVSTTILFLAFMLMTPLGGWSSDYLSKLSGPKAGRRLVPIFSLSLSALLLYMGTGAAGTISAVALMSLAFGFSACSEAPFWASTIHVGGKHVGAACGILNTGSNIGGLIAPILTPFVASLVGWSWGLYAGSLVIMVGVLAWCFVDPTRQISEAGPINLNPALSRDPIGTSDNGQGDGRSEADETSQRDC